MGLNKKLKYALYNASTTTAQHTHKSTSRALGGNMPFLLYGVEHNLISEKAVILTAPSDVMHIMFPSFLQHTVGHLMFRGDDMTTKQTAMQHNTVLLCCNPVEHDKVSQMIFSVVYFH